MPDLFIAKKNILHTKPLGLLDDFCENPKGVSFTNQENDENILLFLRRHIITNVPWIFITILLLLFPIILLPLLQLRILIPFVIPPQYIFIGSLFYYLLVFGYVLTNFASWFYNIGLVTNRRIVDLDYSHGVYVNLAATKVNLVEDINFTQGGFFATFFNFGDVFIQTAADMPNFDFHQVPNPAKVADIIHDLIGEKKV